MTILNKNSQWRYATKKFDATKILDQSQIEQVLEAGSLAPSSYGLQPYQFLIIQDQKLRKELRCHSWNQSQITDASHMILIAAKKEITAQEVDAYVKLRHQVQGGDFEFYKNYGEYVKQGLAKKSKLELLAWSRRQTYLVLGNMLNACAELKIDSCPMEGFEIESYDRILELDQLGLTASVVLTLGYRHREDSNQHRKKYRKTIEDLVIIR